MSEVFTVFYSWQSDRPGRQCRDLIREALDLAADEITRDATIPFRVSVVSDTENEPGLCNIPETLLRRLRESDAVVSDLTFVAQTSSDSPKYCSNPNVLFELGYAFSNLGPARLICVMNEHYGKTENQIFDLAHHRRPISFEFPSGEASRSERVKNLASKLQQALRGVTQLGLTKSSSSDDLKLHQRQLSEIQSYWESVKHRRSDCPYIAITFRPISFRKNRWPDAESLEKVLREKGTRSADGHAYPPQRVGNAPMNWGLYNDTYGDPWTLTYAGQFWTEVSIAGHAPMELSSHDLAVTPDRPEQPALSSNDWAFAPVVLTTLGAIIRLTSRLAELMPDAEPLELLIDANNLGGKWLNLNRLNTFGPCKAPGISRETQTTAIGLRENWLDICVDFGKEFCDLFCRDGRLLSRDDIKSLVEGPIRW